jgi:hypothetical protein
MDSNFSYRHVRDVAGIASVCITASRFFLKKRLKNLKKSVLCIPASHILSGCIYRTYLKFMMCISSETVISQCPSRAAVYSGGLVKSAVWWGFSYLISLTHLYCLIILSGYMFRPQWAIIRPFLSLVQTMFVYITFEISTVLQWMSRWTSTVKLLYKVI